MRPHRAFWPVSLLSLSLQLFFLTNQKRTFDAILTVPGIVGIIYGTLGFLLMAGVSLGKVNSLVPFAVGLIFFFAGINLVKATDDRA